MIGLILVGGSGTRLQGVVSDRPKPLALVAGKPFLRYLTEHLFNNNFTKIYLSCFHLWKQIEEEFLPEIESGRIEIITEPRKLGTGGAISFAINKIFAKNIQTEEVLVCNGDSFLNFDPKKALECHKTSGYPATIIATEVVNTGRYGVVSFDGTKLVEFKEKQPPKVPNETVIINAGVYIISKAMLKYISQDYSKEFSFEQDVVSNLLGNGLINIGCQVVNDRNFIDIGIPEDYARAQELFSR